MYLDFNELQKKKILEESSDHRPIELPDYVPPSQRQDEFIQAIPAALAAGARAVGSGVAAAGRAVGNMASKGVQGAKNMAQQGMQGAKNMVQQGMQGQGQGAGAAQPQAGAQPQQPPQQQQQPPQQQQQPPQQQPSQQPPQEKGPGIVKQAAQGAKKVASNVWDTMTDKSVSGDPAAIAAMSKMGGKSKSKKRFKEFVGDNK